MFELSEMLLQEEMSRNAVYMSSTTELELGQKASFREKSRVTQTLPENLEGPADILTQLGIGWSCRKGLKPDSPNQDSFTILHVEGEFLLAGVLDGHGPKGHHISHFARENIVKLFLTHADRRGNPGAALSEAFVACQRLIEGSEDLDAWESGTTVTFAYCDLKQQKLTIAHAGDSRCTLGKRKAGSAFYEWDDMTVDHKPNLAAEKARIEKANGRVIFDGIVNYRVYVRDGMYPGLNMSRALGDVLAHKRAGVVAQPDVKTVDLSEVFPEYQQGTLLVCSDGVWEFCDTDDAYKLIAQNVTQQSGPLADRLVVEAWDRWLQDSNGEVSDDITAILVHLDVLTGRRKAEALSKAEDAQ